MIVRIWHGRTARNRADEYAAFLERRAIPDYRAIAGNLDVAILRRDEREVTHFLTVTRWISEQAIRAFAGTEVLKAKYRGGSASSDGFPLGISGSGRAVDDDGLFLFG